MYAELKPHPDFKAPTRLAIAVEAERRGDTMVLHYRLTGNVEALAIPPAAEPRRADDLWRHSCFEAFVRPAGGEAYLELNFSPSTEWAAYRFDSYRDGMAELEASPRIRCSVTKELVELHAQVALDLPGPWQVGISAVVEAADGSLSYWALRHPDGRPDFHHRDCFALGLAPAG